MPDNRCPHPNPCCTDNVKSNADTFPNAEANANASASNSINIPPRCHVHEVLGSVMIAEEENGPTMLDVQQKGDRCWPQPEPDEAHNHRFATISGPAIPIPGGHVHEIAVRTDFYDDHFHLITGTSGPAIFVGDRHVHFLSGHTSVSEGHCHQYRAASLIDDPIGD
ncbi:MAG: hypothetical protein GXY67_05050 [Clostridiales bacterium]|nr:hypothetical protein [Clostridiales bacterium]